MNNNISILGCGWLGKALAESLISGNYNVKGSTTQTEKLSNLKALGITPFLINIENISQRIIDFLTADVLIIAITSKNIDAFKKLISSIEKSDLKKIIFISSTSVYNLDNTTVRENTKTKNSPLAKIEQLLLNSTSFKTTILRFGGLFGYDREPGHFFKTNKPISNPEGYINFIHRDDCISIIKNLIEQDVFGEVFNVCADSHPTRRDFYKEQFKKVGRPEPVFDEDSENNYKIVDSGKLKAMLDFEFRFGELVK